MITAIAIDDEPKALEIVTLFASKVPFLDLKASFTNAFEALDYLQTNDVDLLFLDIKMPDISGLDFLRALSVVPMVIFTTAYSEHAVQSYDFDAVDYLLKPFALSRFLKACNKANDSLKTRKVAVSEADSTIFVKTGYEQIRLPLSELLYVEAGGNYVVFVTQSQRIASRLSMTEAEALLPNEQFVRTHRSYIVAKNKIEKFDRYEITIGPYQVPIGINFRDKLLF
jgi:two-component system, LytTR family, response regulator